MNYARIMTTYTPILVLLVLMLVMVVLINVIRSIYSIMPDIKYIKIEISRSTTPEGKRYWRRELMKIYLECLPFSSFLTVENYGMNNPFTYITSLEIHRSFRIRQKTNPKDKK